MTPERRRRRRWAAAAVLLLHAGLWWAWRDTRPTPDRHAAAVQAPVLLRLAAPSTPSTPSATPDDTLPRLPVPRPTLPPAPALEVPAIAALPPAAGPAPTSAATPAAAPATAPAAPSATAPLVLDLPRGASAPRRNPALDDPRANTARATVESRIAKAMQKEWVEEVLGDGRTRWRRGDECVLVKPARDAELDSFNQSSSHRPNQAGAC